VTDSAAAGSAWGSGERVNNGCINYSIQGNALVPLMQYAKQAGKSTGLVSTCRITHATPASFAANVLDRDLEATIANQYLEREVDLLMGGGLEYFITEGRNLSSEFKRRGYSFVTDQVGLSNLTDARRILGLFADSHLPYAIDRKNDSAFAQIPSLATMFKAALRPLSENENGFVLQVEAGRIDHAGHANDPAAILHELLEFDNCIPIALDFLKWNPDTLVIVTTDHGTGGCQLNGVGKRYNGSGSALDRINNFRGSFESIERIYKKTGKFSRVHFNSICDLGITKAQELEIVEKMLAGSDYMTSVIADAIAAELYQETGVGWTSHDHTSELVELAAVGRGAEHFPNLLKNYEVNGIVRNLLRI
jgi:alkaline phosphatase